MGGGNKQQQRAEVKCATEKSGEERGCKYNDHGGPTVGTIWRQMGRRGDRWDKVWEGRLEKRWRDARLFLDKDRRRLREICPLRPVRTAWRGQVGKKYIKEEEKGCLSDLITSVLHRHDNVSEIYVNIHIIRIPLAGWTQQHSYIIYTQQLHQEGVTLPPGRYGRYDRYDPTPWSYDHTICEVNTCKPLLCGRNADSGPIITTKSWIWHWQKYRRSKLDHKWYVENTSSHIVPLLLYYILSWYLLM